MTLVQDRLHEAVAEVLATFRKTHRRMGEFQIAKKTISKIIKRRFGLSYYGHGEGRRLTDYVVDTLLERGVLELWNTIVKKQSTQTIYQANTAALMNDI